MAKPDRGNADRGDVDRQTSASHKKTALWALRCNGGCQTPAQCDEIMDGDVCAVMWRSSKRAVVFGSLANTILQGRNWLNDPDAQVRVAALRALRRRRDSVMKLPRKRSSPRGRSSMTTSKNPPPSARPRRIPRRASPPRWPVRTRRRSRRSWRNWPQGIAAKNDADAAAKLVVSLATAPATADALTRSILDTLTKSLKDAPAMTPELSAALGKLLRQRRERQRAPARGEVGQGR